MFLVCHEMLFLLLLQLLFRYVITTDGWNFHKGERLPLFTDITASHARQIQTRPRPIGARRLPGIGLSGRLSLLPASVPFPTGDLARVIRT